ncbi:putative Parathyroid hormone/parathyroid hormone-related peptide receptor-like 2 [Homarus americanus]|uniref:Putative Parathyroid hormone/parathyroid hormone-related peptide receptor-like 2 n=1 Tax=Homarus americanus TaxID=6706 RepID=A0A8J5N8P4_HOMAM|nr:putative Parathyroid hormone/parathyroid hormone-related peptide receptor-like 2 [Homarus americanus]
MEGKYLTLSYSKQEHGIPSTPGSTTTTTTTTTTTDTTLGKPTPASTHSQSRFSHGRGQTCCPDPPNTYLVIPESHNMDETRLVPFDVLWCQCQGNASATPHQVLIHQQVYKMHQDASTTPSGTWAWC